MQPNETPTSDVAYYVHRRRDCCEQPPPRCPGANYFGVFDEPDLELIDSWGDALILAAELWPRTPIVDRVVFTLLE